jgi:Dolichol kinase
MKSEVSAELKRKSIHVIPGFLAYPVIIWMGRLAGVIISAFFLLLYTLNEISLRKGLNIKVPIAYDTYEIMARPEERQGRYFTGTIYFWLLTLTTIILLEPRRAVAAIMISSLGDAAAAITGKAIDGPRWPFNKRKTLSGSLAMLATSISSCLIVGLQLPTSLLASLTATAIEASTRTSVLDELTVPLALLLVLLFSP